MKVDIRQVEKILTQLAEINKPLLCDLELYDGDTPLNISEQTADDWDMAGMGNVYFIKALLEAREAGAVPDGYYPGALSDDDKAVILARATLEEIKQGDAARL